MRGTKPWSKLQRQVYLIIDPTIKFQIQCRVYAMGSTFGSTGLPRYWITLGRETIWDYPRQFIDTPHPEREHASHYPYGTDISAISELLREYLDTPRSVLQIVLVPASRLDGRERWLTSAKSRNRLLRGASLLLRQQASLSEPQPKASCPWGRP